MYYDYGADYYFLMKNNDLQENMKKQMVKLNETQLRRIVKESVNRILKENKVRTNTRTIKESGHLYGHYDDESRSLINDMFLGSFLMQYKTFITAKLEQ